MHIAQAQIFKMVDKNALCNHMHKNSLLLTASKNNALLVGLYFRFSFQMHIQKQINNKKQSITSRNGAMLCKY